MKKLENILYKDNPAQALDVYLPDKCESVFLYFHGGGLTGGDKRDVSAFSEYLSEHHIALVSANYRMYPQGKYPDFIEDAAGAVAWTHGKMHELFGCDKLFVGGSSAGGYLSMMLCFDRRYLAAVGLDNSVITGFLHDAGQPTAHFTVLEKSGIDPRRVIIDETSALYYVGLEEHYPPMRFVVSDNDLRNRYEQTMLLLSTLAHFGYSDYDHVLMHGGHCAYCGAFDENGISVFGRMIVDFIKKVTQK